MRILITASLILLSLSINAQSISKKEENAIRSRLEAYFIELETENYETMMDYIYPKVFEFITKDQMVLAFTSLESMGIKFSFNDVKTNYVKPLSEEGNNKYVYISYTAGIDVRLLTAQMQSSDVIESLKASFKETYNTDKVDYDDNSKTLTLVGSKYIIGILNPDYTDDMNWYFIEFDDTNPQMAEMLLGQEIFKKLLAALK